MTFGIPNKMFMLTGIKPKPTTNPEIHAVIKANSVLMCSRIKTSQINLQDITNSRQIS